MELLLHILMYLGLLAPGNYTSSEVDTMLTANQQQMNLVQTDPLLLEQAGQTSLVGVLVIDDKEN